MDISLVTVLALVATLAGLLVECRPSVYSLSSPRSDLSNQPTIIGGQDAYDGQFPYVLEMEYFGSAGWKHICQAVLISPFYALSTGRCLNNINRVNIRLYGGLLVRENYTLTNAHQISVSDITVHELYNEFNEGYPYDIAMLRLAWAADLNRPNIDVATLPTDDSNDYSNQDGTIVGWGRYGLEQAFAWTLQWASIRILSIDECRQYFTAITGAVIFDTHICVLSEPVGTGPCTGDAGGPLILGESNSHVVIGLSSWTVMQNGYCNENFPTTFTRLSKYLDWIKANSP